jgi:hypothetical protein
VVSAGSGSGPGMVLMLRFITIFHVSESDVFCLIHRFCYL